MRRATAPVAIAVMVAGAAPIKAAGFDFPVGYAAHHTHAELRAEMEALALAHPEIASLRSMGRSYGGRKMFVLKISDRVMTDESEPEVYIDGGIHGDEHASTEQALALAEWLIEGYASDPRAAAIVDSTEIWIAPMVNPDGAMFDVSGGVFHDWRKNRQPNSGSTALGTDINRNFGYRWGGSGSSGDPVNAFYRGPKAWSTPESRRIRDFVRGRVVNGVQQIRLALTVHSHGEFVMYPFGWTSQALPSDMSPGDSAKMKALAEGMAARNGYRAVQAGALYRSSGTFMDWAYARQRILALTIELSPRASVEDGAYVKDGDLPALLERNRDALMWFLEQAG